VRQLNRGSTRTLTCKNENIVAALREIAAGQVAIEGKKQKAGKN
jgi:DNA-directed RNA polymerase subunit K/omega